MSVPRRRLRVAVVALGAVVSLAVAGCAEPASDEHVIDEPVTIVEGEGPGGVALVELTIGAAERLDITTAAVEADGDATVVPNDAIIVDPEGGFWVYTNPEELVFVRVEIAIDHQSDDAAILTDGPPVGTPVVTLGAAELYGAERGIGH